MRIIEGAGVSYLKTSSNAPGIRAGFWCSFCQTWGRSAKSLTAVPIKSALVACPAWIISHRHNTSSGVSNPELRMLEIRSSWGDLRFSAIRLATYCCREIKLEAHSTWRSGDRGAENSWVMFPAHCVTWGIISRGTLYIVRITSRGNGWANCLTISARPSLIKLSSKRSPIWRIESSTLASCSEANTFINGARKRWCRSPSVLIIETNGKPFRSISTTSGVKLTIDWRLLTEENCLGFLSTLMMSS